MSKQFKVVLLTHAGRLVAYVKTEEQGHSFAKDYIRKNGLCTYFVTTDLSA